MKTLNHPATHRLALLTLALVAGLTFQNSAFAQKGGRSGGSKSGGGFQMNSGGHNGNFQQNNNFSRTNGNQNGGFQNGGLKHGGQFNGNPFGNNKQNGRFMPSGNLQSNGGLQQGSFKPGSLNTLPGNGTARNPGGLNTGKFKPTAGIGGAGNPLPGKVGSLIPVPNSKFGIGGITKPSLPLIAGHNHHNGHNHWKHLQNPWCHTPRVELINHCNYLRSAPHLHWNYTTWCNYYPTRCHWWYNWCGSSYYFDPSCCVSYNWHYYPCTVVYGGVTQRFSWHLGMNCVFIPGRGLGVQEVEPGSPAELAGFQPGMVLVAANGLALNTEGVFQAVIESSNGMLTLAVKSDAEAEPVSIDIQMTRFAISNF